MSHTETTRMENHAVHLTTDPRPRGLSRAHAVIVTLIAGLCAMGAFGSLARADTPNTISQLTNVVGPGSMPTNSLPQTVPDDPSNGTAYAGPTSTSTSPPANGDDDYSQSFVFDYGGGPGSPTSADGSTDETVQTLSLDLPPGLLASLAAAKDFCTPDELGTMPNQTDNGTGWLGGAPDDAGCPADSQIGEIGGSVETLGLTLPISGNLYLMQPANPDDIAQVAVEVEVSLLGPWERAEVASGPIQFVTENGQPALQVALTLPSEATLADADNAGPAGILVPYTLLNLTQTINGLTPGGAPFTRMPSSDTPAIGTSSVTVDYNGSDDNSGNSTTADQIVSGQSGTGNASITPTGAASLPYAPQVSAAVTRDGTDPDVALNTTITQAGDEVASSKIQLTLPTLLQPNLTNALSALCTAPNATASNCQPIGTVTADTPLLPAPLSGTVYLTGTSTGPQLTLSFPPPVGFTISGAVDLLNHTITFPTIPDLPLTALHVNIAGGPSGIYETTCTSTSNTASVAGAFTGQNGATGSSTGTFGIAGCPGVSAVSAPAPRATTLTGPPVVRSQVHRLSASRGRITMQILKASGSTPFSVVTLSAPKGLSFVGSAAKSSVAAIGGRIKSATVSHGQLKVVLATSAQTLYLTLYRPAFQESSSLARRIEHTKVTALPFGLTLTTPSLGTVNLTTSATL